LRWCTNDFQLEAEGGREQIPRVSTAPGYSEQHSARALDVTTSGYAALDAG
jgi:zinc D-Ala-D-Ala carboxypeptidase